LSQAGLMSGRGISGGDVWPLQLAGPYLNRRRGDHLMAAYFEPKISILPKAQQEIWPLLAPAPGLSFVLYGGTAVALHLGHRTSVDFDFFRSAPLDKKEIEASFAFVRDAETIQEAENTVVIMAAMPSGPVR